MKVLENLKYTKSHEWVEDLGDGNVRIGITDFAQKELGDIVFINLPSEGDQIEKGDSFSDIESVKAVSDLFSPCSGEVTRINEEILDNPQLVNEDAFKQFFIEIKVNADLEDLLSAEEYKKMIE